ncbi:MAG: biopolymer transporter ExbD [Myxococcota bacterium]
MGMSAGGKGGANSEINVTPLVDVCLVLLIIFMVMVPQSVPEISVRVPPEGTPRNDAPRVQPLVVGLTENGGLTLNQEPLDRTRLFDALQRQLEVRDKKVVFVDFDSQAKYGTAVEVLDLASEAGAEVLGVMRRRNEPTPDTLKG